MKKLLITTTDVVNGSVYLAGTTLDPDDVNAQACLDKGIAQPVSMETDPESVPAPKLKKEKGA